MTGEHALPDPLWNPEPRPYGRGSTMNELFRRAAEADPDGIALVQDGRRLDYRTLDLASDHYAALLEDAGVAHGDIVPLLLPRGIELVVAMLAVLKRGAAYAAMDTRWPVERIAQLTEQFAPRLLVTAEEGDWGLPTLVPPADPTDAASVPPGGHRRPTPVEVHGDDACTVFFTSGTTGPPKGVVSLHRGTARLWDDCVFSDFGPGSATAQIASSPWDGFTYDCWGSLLCGGKAVFTDSLLLPETLRRLVAGEGVTHGFITVSLFNMIVDEGVDAFSGLKTVMVGGEKLSPVHCRRFLERHPDIELLNVYGPVECTVIATTHRITPADCVDPAGLPIGRPLPHTSLHVLDGDRVCAVGEPGEICIGGDALARGYLDPELTARKFTEVALDGPGSAPTRVYRTGDLGYWAQGGELRFAGRLDRQVKMRGLRIEVEEIEVCATANAGPAGLADVSVVPVIDPVSGGCTALSLFYTSHGSEPLAAATLRETLAAQLPAYMVPSRIERLDRLPLTANGKLDRAELARLAAARPVEEGGDGQPETAHDATEERVAAAFGAVLGLDPVPLTRSFFDLGGNSLDAARLCARLGGAELGVEAAQLYRTPDVRSFAAWLNAQDQRPEHAEEAPATDGRIRLTSMQDVFLVRDELHSVVWRLTGRVDVDALTAALGDVHRRHQALHARYLSQEIPVALLPETPGDPEFHRLAAEDGAEPLGRLLAVLEAPLGTARGRIWRSALLPEDAPEAGAGSWLFGLSIHHIAFDGWSQALITDDLSVAYAARAAGREPVFAEEAPGLAEANQEHFRHLDRVDLDSQRAYWTEQLGGLPELGLPGATTSWAPSGPIAVHRTALDEADLARIDAAATATGVPRFTFLFAALAEALRELSGQDDFVVTVPVASRGGHRLDRAVTNRVDLLCLRTGSGPDALRPERVRETVNQALAHQELPFGEVLLGLVAGNDVSGLLSAPMLAWQDNEPSVLELPGLVATALALPRTGATGRLVVEVDPHTAAGLGVNVVLRTDMLPDGLAARVAEEFVAALRRRADGRSVPTAVAAAGV